MLQFVQENVPQLTLGICRLRQEDNLPEIAEFQYRSDIFIHNHRCFKCIPVLPLDLLQNFQIAFVADARQMSKPANQLSVKTNPAPRNADRPRHPDRKQQPPHLHHKASDRKQLFSQKRDNRRINLKGTDFYCAFHLYRE